MRFPPPVRYYAPLLVLVFGMAAVYLDYELNLSNDLTRNANDVSDQEAATGTRLAKLSVSRLSRGEVDLLREDLASWADEPGLLLAAVTDDAGTVIADSNDRWPGRRIQETPLSPAWEPNHRTAAPGDPSTAARWKADGTLLYSSRPLTAGPGRSAWLLLGFDRHNAIAQARSDAGKQLLWVASAMAFLCFCLWAALHLGLASRLTRLTRSVKQFGEEGAGPLPVLEGGDEVSDLSAAFHVMTAKLAERARERQELEKEILEASERERRRIGNDLHDDIGQRLTAASLASYSLASALEKSSPDLLPVLGNLGSQIRGVMASVRSLSHGLIPVSVADGGLLAALRVLCESTSGSTAIRCVLDSPSPVRIPDEITAGHLYRIAQEAMNNALKHAAASEIRIGLEQRNGMLILEIDDDGEGLPEFLPSLEAQPSPDGKTRLPPPGRRGIGLQLMRHRAEIIGGSLGIGSAPAGGTRVRCLVPLPPTPPDHV